MSNNSYVSIGYMPNGRQNNDCCEKPTYTPEAAAASSDCDRIDGTHVFFDTCDSQQEICVSSTCADQQSQGRILDVVTTLHNVCPGRRSAVGLTLTEVDNDGSERARGFRAITVPAHHSNCSRDVQLESVRFILPEDVSLQRRRHFVCRVDHHYMDDNWN